MSSAPPAGKKRRWKRILFLSAALWILFAPDFLTELAVEKIVESKLDRGDCGLSCEKVEFSGFGLWKLLLLRDPGRLEINGLRYDAGALSLTGAVDRAEAVVDIRARHRDGDEKGRISLSGCGKAFDWVFALSGRIDLSWSNLVSAAGSANLVLCDGDDDLPYALDADFAATPDGWSASARVPPFRFSENDPVAGRLASRVASGAVSNLLFSGSFSADASVRRQGSMPAAEWAASARIEDFSASADAGSSRFAVEGLSVRPSVSGIAGHVDFNPFRIRAKSLEASGVVLSGVRADVRADMGGVLVTEASAGVCGGTASLYALSLDRERLAAGFTLFLSDLDAGEALSHVGGFRGEATGRMHGRVPVRLRMREGLEVRLGDSFLYSTPGETGFLKLGDASLVTDSLRAGGYGADACDGIAKALSNLEYKVLRLNLSNTSGGDATLTVKLDGSAVVSDKSVPVDLTVNVNGPIETLLNFGIRAATVK